MKIYQLNKKMDKLKQLWDRQFFCCKCNYKDYIYVLYPRLTWDVYPCKYNYVTCLIGCRIL